MYYTVKGVVTLPVRELAMDDLTAPSRRQNSNLAEIVRFGITLQALKGRQEAERYLIRRGVDTAIIDRVLSPGPARRVMAQQYHHRPQ